jgi:hypothetical protein
MPEHATTCRCYVCRQNYLQKALRQEAEKVVSGERDRKMEPLADEWHGTGPGQPPRNGE